MWRNVFGSSASAQTPADKMGAAITKLDAILLSHSEVSQMQQSMAAAHRDRAAAELAASNRPAAIRAARKAVACDQQVAHIEEIIASTTMQQQALQLSAIHASSIAGVADASAALRSAPDADCVAEQLDVAADMLAAVEETQGVYSSMVASAGGAALLSDDELLSSIGVATPPAQPPAPTLVPPLPAVPSAAPSAPALVAPLGALLEFA